MFLVSTPHAIILYSIRPRVDALAINLVLTKLSFIDAAIGTEKLPISALSSVFELTFVRWFVLECFVTFTVRLLVQPLSLIESPIRVFADTEAVHLIFHPLAFVYCSVSEVISAFSVTFSALPHPKIERFVSRQIQTGSLKFLINYYAHVHGSVLKR